MYSDAWHSLRGHVDERLIDVELADMCDSTEGTRAQVAAYRDVQAYMEELRGNREVATSDGTTGTGQTDTS